MTKQMHLTAQLPSGYGIEAGSWRWPGEKPDAMVDIDVFVKGAQEAERGKMDAFFIADIPGLTEEIASQPPLSGGLDPIVMLTAMALATERVGLVATMSSSFNEPYTIARQFQSLNIISKGRIGWNVVTTGRPFALLNYFSDVPDSPSRHARSREVVEAVRQLWDSWPEDALVLDVERGVFANPHRIQPVNYRGSYVSTRGPLLIPSTSQGSPVIFTAGGGREGFQFAIDNADAVYANPFDLEGAKNYWRALTRGAQKAGRSSGSMSMFSGVITSVASTEHEALQRREELDRLGDIESRKTYLGYMLSIRVDDLDLDAPLPADRLLNVRPNPNDPRSSRAVELAFRGLTIREILAYGPINYHPVALGTPVQVADMLQTWFEAGVGGGFNITPDSGLTALTDFVDEVVPILQKRGLLRSEYETTTLRGHLGVVGKVGS